MSKQDSNTIERTGGDIFDRIMHTRLLRPLEPFYKRNKEVLMYLLFGALTTVVSIGTFWLFGTVLGLHELVANVISWIFAVTFAYVTNKIWVFDSKVSTPKGIAQEAAAFYGGRLLTLGFESAMLAVFVTWLGMNELVIKIVATVGVLVLNYIISKLFVFKNKDNAAKGEK